MDNYDLDKWFEGQTEGKIFDKPVGQYFGTNQKTKVIQFCGIEVILFEDGAYNLSDTSGG